MMIDWASQDVLSPSAYVILGMIWLGRRSGYEIKQAVQLSIRFFWTISQAQIYPTLEQLEQSKLVQGHDEPQGRRPRRVYDLTPAGEATLEQWLVNDEPLSYELRDTGLLKIFFADLLDRDAALALIDKIQRRSREHVAQLRAIQPAGETLADDVGYSFPLITLRLGIAYHQAIADECAAIHQEITNRSQ
jgi:PadR family transcriptional regulator, regulatory protein AphA